MISPEDAWDRLAAHLTPLPPRRLPRHLLAGRVLAEGVRATVDVPFADVSAMDGYAIAGEVPVGARLAVLGRVAAGEAPSLVVQPGSAVRIMTGAPLPTGADRVVRVEDTDGGRETMEVRVPPPPGANVRRRGEVHEAGDPLLAAGDRLTAGALALLAANGIAEAAVHAPPRLALLVTGDELVSPEQTPGRGQLRDSHSAFLTAAAAAAGGEVLHLGIARDDRQELRSCLARGLDADLLMATGGVSRGELDLVEPVLAELGFEPLFDAVAIQPGRPMFAALRARTGPAAGGSPTPLLALGLPGNPASAMVCFWLFVRPALLRLQGVGGGFWAGALRARLAAPLPGAPRRDRFLPARLEAADGELRVTPELPRGSHDLVAYARGNGLVRVRAGSPAAPVGAPCSVLPFSAE